MAESRHAPLSHDDVYYRTIEISGLPGDVISAIERAIDLCGTWVLKKKFDCQLGKCSRAFVSVCRRIPSLERRSPYALISLRDQFVANALSAYDGDEVKVAAMIGHPVRVHRGQSSATTETPSVLDNPTLVISQSRTARPKRRLGAASRRSARVYREAKAMRLRVSEEERLVRRVAARQGRLSRIWLLRREGSVRALELGALRRFTTGYRVATSKIQ